MKYYLSFPLRGEFLMEEPSLEFDADFMEPFTEQWFPEPVSLSGQEIAEYEREIDFSLHDIEDTRQMLDNTGILKELGRDWLRERIECADLSVCVKNCSLSGVITLNTEKPLTEYEVDLLDDYLEKQFYGKWKDTLQEKKIPVSGGWMKLKICDPQVFHLEREKKYEITNIPHPKYPWLHRIRARMQVNEQVAPDDLGGFVESEHNLSQDGSCWIYDRAICCGEAVVENEARMFDDTLARDSALIKGDARLYDRAAAEGQCIIRCGEIKESGRVAGNAVISEGIIDGLSPLITGESSIYGEIRGRFIIKDVVLPGEKLVNPTPDLFLVENGKRSVMAVARELKPSPKYQPKKKKSKEMER